MERDRELEVLDQRLDACARGRGHVALVSGGIACGKTEFLHTFAERAAQAGAVLLTASGARTEQMLRFGVMAQLFQSTTLPPSIEQQVHELLREDIDAEAAGPNAATGPELAPMCQTNARIVRGLCAALFELARERTVVVSVDDLQFADDLSVQALLYMQRRTRLVRVMMVLGEWAHPRLTRPSLSAEITRQPHVSRIQLGLLSRDGVERVLDDRLGTRPDPGLVSACYAASGGNPMLVHALLEDHCAATPGCRATDLSAPAGRAFGHAVLFALHRWDANILRVAQGVAVLAGATEPARLGKLLELTTESAGQALDVLESAGLLHEGGFRSQVAENVLLENIESADRDALRVRAAELLHQDGVCPAKVAAHLLLAEHPGGPWAVPVLRAAAERALEDNDVDLAVRHLELAHQASADERERADLSTTLARVEWRRDPTAALRYLAPLRDALTMGELADHNVITLVKHLLWHGHFDEVSEIFARLAGADEQGERIGDDLRVAYQWLSHLYPSIFEAGLMPDPDGTGPESSATWVRISTAFHEVLARGRREDAVASAEYVLQSCRLNDDNLEALFAALQALICTEEYTKAGWWCASLLAEAGTREVHTWRALLLVVQAEVALRQGAPRLATDCAREALELLPPAGWGTSIGAPMSVLIQAAIASGDHEQAAELLAQPVPAAIFQTRSGLQYLHARGRYYLATDRLQAALGDLRHCGELMDQWGLDLPALVPWRADAAQAQLLLGRRDRAKELIDQQLLLPTGDGPRARGVCLRVLAATGRTGRRVALLRESVDLLTASGDLIELAAALSDLGDAYESTGELDQAHLISHQAARLSRECEIATVPETNRPAAKVVPLPEPRELPTGPDQLEMLSNAERRVATLAAIGHTNREIARKLYITVSTVEQHLTRVYRKLKVQSRSDLQAGMQLQCAN